MEIKEITKTLAAAIKELDAFPDDQRVKMGGGKLYVQVKDRVNILRKHFGAIASIKTEALRMDDVIQFRTEILIDGVVVAVGHAEAIRSKAKDAPVEKTETKSIGRALAVLGIAGSEFASVEEMLEVEGIEIQAHDKPKSIDELLDQAYDKLLAIAPDDVERIKTLNKAFAYLKKMKEAA